MAAVLAAMTRERPNDPQAYRFLAIAQGASQNIPAAVRALRQAVRLAPERADLWELLGEALVAEGDGQVTSEAQDAFRHALARDPRSASARFHLARAQIAAGDKAGGLAAWRALLADLPPNDIRRAELTQAIAQAEGQPEGESAAAQIASAPPEGQLAMIQGMVQSLAQRLKSNPDDPDGWVRLVRAYAVLGDTSRRDAALKEARSRYADRSDLLSKLEAAARAEPMS
jgi:cytochrome c-type biogenesis protein CcmH